MFKIIIFIAFIVFMGLFIFAPMKIIEYREEPSTFLPDAQVFVITAVNTTSKMINSTFS